MTGGGDKARDSPLFVKDNNTVESERTYARSQFLEKGADS